MQSHLSISRNIKQLLTKKICANPLQKIKSIALFASVAALLSTPSAHATTLYWDTNGNTSGAGTGGVATGTWDTGTTANWTTDPTGASTTTAYTSGSDVV